MTISVIPSQQESFANPHLVQETSFVVQNTRVSIRKIRPDDNAIERQFIEGLSPQSNYYRFMGALPHPTESLINQFTHVDFSKDMALIATIQKDSEERQIAVGRYVGLGHATCEFAIAVADQWQGRGIGSRIMGGLIDSARGNGYRKIFGTIFSENRKMIAFIKKLGFSIKPDRSNPVISIAELAL